MTDLVKETKRKEIIKKCYGVFSGCFLVFAMSACVVLADDDATIAINNLTRIICNIVTAIGVLLAIWGVVQFGMSFSSHDPSQRNQALFQIVGGIVVAIAPQLLKTLLAGTSVDLSALPESGRINPVNFINMFFSLFQ